jgi:hypothetical protein
VADDGKQSTHFVEVGVSYYIAGTIDRLRGTAGGNVAERLAEGRGPFVTVKYAWGELPPYLRQDDQVSVGVGLTF